MRSSSQPSQQPPPSPPVALQGPVADVSDLAGQIARLSIQRASLQAQWNGLRRQLNAMRLDNPARPSVAQQWADVGGQLAQVDGQIAFARAQLAVRNGQLPGAATEQPPPPDRSGLRGDQITAIVIVFMLVALLPISIGITRRLLRRPPKEHAPPPDAVSPRLDRLEQAVDTIAIEIERISEGQRFITKILAERPGSANGNVAAQGEMANGGTSSSEPQPLLALGAGPAEQVRVKDRDAARVKRDA